MCCVLSCVLGVNLMAQDKVESYGIFEDPQQYDEFMRQVKTEGQNNAELMAMVPMINDIVLMQPFGTTSKQYGTADGTLGILADESVRKELEMIDSQYEELQKTNEELQKKFAQQIRELDLTDMKSAVGKIIALNQESEQQIQSTLLPHQMKQLRQLAARRQLSRRGLIDLITNEPLKSTLEVSDDLAKELRAAEREMEAELERQISELRAKARKRLLSKLSSQQRGQVEELFGNDLNTDRKKRKSKK